MDDPDEDDKMDENYREPEKPLKSNFLYELPGITVSPSDSEAYRIEALRVYLEKVLGDDIFVAAYKHLINSSSRDVEDDGTSLEEIVGAEKINFVNLIHHLIVCEDTYYKR